MASKPASLAEAFRKLQAGDAVGALSVAERILAGDPSHARAHLAAGIALRMSGRLVEAAAALARAREADPRDHAAAYEAGIVHQLQGAAAPALEAFEASARLRPDFFAAHLAAGLLHAERREWKAAVDCFRRVLQLKPGQPEALLQLALALGRANRHDEAEATFVQALATHPGDLAIIRAFGQYSAARANFRRAASLFAEAVRLAPGDDALPMYLAQCELLLGRWPAAWEAYARRESRREFARAAAAAGRPYVLPRLEALDARRVTLVSEQGLGDVLFFLRWAPLLRERAGDLAFAGEPRLHGPLGRTGLFSAFDAARDPAGGGADRILVGDLPALFLGADPLALAPLAIAPLPERLAHWEAALGRLGSRPWIGVQWRAGTPREASRTALSKEAPLEALFAALGAREGTLLALQRGVTPEELARAAGSAGRPVHDLSRANDGLEDLLAIVALLDRHVAVSSTTMHLAAGAGASADVLVPFPPEWRWRAEGDSPWFPGFRTHRQDASGDWSAAIASAARGG